MVMDKNNKDVNENKKYDLEDINYLEELIGSIVNDKISDLLLNKQVMEEYYDSFRELKSKLVQSNTKYLNEFKASYEKELEERYKNTYEKLDIDNEDMKESSDIYKWEKQNEKIYVLNKNKIRNNLKKNFNSYKLENNLNELIFKYGVTKTELSETLGISRSTLNNIIDKKTGITLETAFKISKIFGISINDIFSYEIK